MYANTRLWLPTSYDGYFDRLTEGQCNNSPNDADPQTPGRYMVSHLKPCTLGQYIYKPTHAFRRATDHTILVWFSIEKQWVIEKLRISTPDPPPAASPASLTLLAISDLRMPSSVAILDEAPDNIPDNCKQDLVHLHDNEVEFSDSEHSIDELSS
ncbi:hypothetical protein PAPYR_11144 [Paratrimastix pyriformis]|uniref:Uncharacterized protein n=1 Tax=Paratrimastix pyriformis TaxID=342808 RepID=A0ABQ8U4C1_9EUKA|nr:hypothetical protein PAPYR_11144 [Paratrimastix pyriformis]